MRDTGRQAPWGANRNGIFRLPIAFGLAALIAATGCHAKVPNHSLPDSPVARSVAQALSALPATADAHRKTAAVAAWMTATLQPQRHQPAGDALTVLESRSADPMSSALLFTAMLRNLRMESRTRVVTGVPGFGWYPLIEVLDADGDHLWDPFTGRYAPDYDGTPLGFSEALSATTIFGANGTVHEESAGSLDVPAFAELSLQPSFVWQPRIASPVRATIDFRSGNEFKLGKQGSGDSELAGLGKDGEYWPGFAVAGVTSNELGPVVLMHSYALQGLKAGAIYELRLTLAQGAPAHLLIMADKAVLTTRKVSGADTMLRFAAADTAATVNIGTLGTAFVRFNAIRWSRE